MSGLSQMVNVLSRLIVNLVKMTVCAVTRPFNWSAKSSGSIVPSTFYFCRLDHCAASRLTSSMRYLYIGDLGSDHDN
jgi:hypothetical protein